MFASDNRDRTRDTSAMGVLEGNITERLHKDAVNHNSCLLNECEGFHWNL